MSKTTAVVEPPPPTPPRQEPSFVSDVAREYAEEVRIADQLLAEIAARDSTPTYSEYLYFTRCLGWAKPKVGDQVRRMHQVARFRAIAGTPADRDAAIAERDKSASVLASQSPKLAAEIERLTAQLERLERDATDSASRVAHQESAVTTLRELAPDDVKAEHAGELDRIRAAVGNRLSDSKMRSNELESCLNPDRFTQRDLYWDLLRRSFREAVLDVVDGGSLSYRYSDAWPGIRAAMKAELDTLAETIRELTAEHDSLIATANVKLDFYSSGKTTEYLA